MRRILAAALLCVIAHGHAATIENLSNDRTYWFRGDGSDTTCNGLKNAPANAAPGCAFRNPQRGIRAAAGVNLNNHNIAIRCGQTPAPSTFTQPVAVIAPWIGSGTVSLVGDPVTPTNCTIVPKTGDAINVSGGGMLFLSGFSLGADASRGFSSLVVGYGSQITVNGAMNYRCAFVHLFAPHGGSIVHVNNPPYTVSCGFAKGYHIFAGDTGGKVTTLGTTATVTAELTFHAWAMAKHLGFVSSGSKIDTKFAVHAKKFIVESGAVISVAGHGLDYFPGDEPGIRATGGIYDTSDDIASH